MSYWTTIECRLTCTWWAGRSRLTEHVQRRHRHRQAALGCQVGRLLPANFYSSRAQIDAHVVELDVKLAVACRETVNFVDSRWSVAQRVEPSGEMSWVATNSRYASSFTTACRPSTNSLNCSLSILVAVELDAYDLKIK